MGLSHFALLLLAAVSVPGASSFRNAINTANSMIPPIPDAPSVHDAINKATIMTSSTPGVPSIQDANSKATTMAPPIPGASSVRNAMSLATNMTPPIPGIGDMMSMASGGIESMVKMMLKMIDMQVVYKLIQRAYEIMKITMRSGLKLLDAKMQDVFGIKEFSRGAEELARESEVPEFLIATVMGFTAVLSQALLFVP